MIYLRACEIAGVQSRSRGFKPNFGATSSRHTPEICWRSFRRVVTRFDDRERPAHLCAERLRREREASSLRLACLTSDPPSISVARGRRKAPAAASSPASLTLLASLPINLIRVMRRWRRTVGPVSAGPAFSNFSSGLT